MNLFTYKVNLALNSILFNLTELLVNSLKDKTSNDNTSFYYFIRTHYNQTNIKEFDNQIKNIGNAFIFSLNKFNLLTRNNIRYRTMQSKSLTIFNNVDTSSSFANLNLVYNQCKLLYFYF